MSELGRLTDELRPIFNQTRVEHEMLARAQEALIVALNWETEGSTFTRKLSSVRFAAHTFQQHLERVIAIEEHDGYMNFVTEECPRLTEAVTRLNGEHCDFRNDMNSIMTSLERLLPTDHAGLASVRAEINGLLRRLADHSRREIELILSALNDDLGTGD